MNTGKPAVTLFDPIIASVCGIVKFFEGLRSLYYGNPDLYVTALKTVFEVVPT